MSASGEGAGYHGYTRPLTSSARLIPFTGQDTHGDYTSRVSVSFSLLFISTWLPE